MRLNPGKLSPSMVAGCGILLIFSFAIVSRLAQQFGLLNPHVQIVLGEDDGRGFSDERPVHSYQPPPPIMDGEVIRTTERVREVSALMLALLLYTAKHQLQGRVAPDVGRLLLGVKHAGLLPPGMFLTGIGTLAVTHQKTNGEAQSHGTLSVRYRVHPVALEVISLGSVRRDGPAILMRAPIDEPEGKEVTYFTSRSLDQITIPQPFSSQADVLGAGWNKASLNAADVPAQVRSRVRNEILSLSQKRTSQPNHVTPLNP